MPGARSRQVSLILNSEELFAEWKRDIKTMAGRIIDMRKELHRLLTEELKTPGNWDHIVNQIGMFRYVRCDVDDALRSGLGSRGLRLGVGGVVLCVSLCLCPSGPGGARAGSRGKVADAIRCGYILRCCPSPRSCASACLRVDLCVRPLSLLGRSEKGKVG